MDKKRLIRLAQSFKNNMDKDPLIRLATPASIFVLALSIFSIPLTVDVNGSIWVNQGSSWTIGNL